MFLWYVFADVRGILCAPRVPDMVKKLLADYGIDGKSVRWI
jgi:RecB family endonuclease NucS